MVNKVLCVTFVPYGIGLFMLKFSIGYSLFV